MTECQRCGAISPNPYPSLEAIASFYSSALEPNEFEDTYYVHLDRNPVALRGPQRLANQFTRLLGRPGRLLEIGCAGGWVLKSARDCGWTVKGVELAPKFSRFAREELGLDVHEGSIASVDTANWPKFDVIVLFDVFEHLHDPVTDMGRLRHIADDGAYLIITTPNIASPAARYWGLDWRQVIPSHVVYSTPESMRIALARAGWHVESISEPRYWDPDPQAQRRMKVQEIVKLAARSVLFFSIVKPSERFPALRRLPSALSRGRLTWEGFIYRAGTQPVLGDVMLVVARAA